MRATVKKTCILLLVFAIPLLLSGCICWPCCWSDAPPRRAIIHVYVYDYYSGAPVSWAVAELYEEDWWYWDYIGSWAMDPGGHAVLYGEYLDGGECSDCDSETYRIVVTASGYYGEACEFRLDYYHPSESVYFYLLPYYGREDAGGAEAPAIPEDEGRLDRVLVGQPRDAGGVSEETDEEGAP